MNRWSNLSNGLSLLQESRAASSSLRVGGIGYRLQLPQKVRPVSAGIRGGIVGGLVMPLPALAYGLTSGHGIWYPINLLAGVVLPGIGESSVADLEQFHRGLFIAGLIFHGAFSVFFGLMYGVLLPMLPDIPKPLAWGGLLMPLLWTAASFSLLGLVNPVLQKGIDWPWFIASQFVFGVVSALVVIRAEGLPRILAGILGGLAGGLLMPLPALLWSLATGHGIWYPMNLLAGMILPGIDQRPVSELYQFHAAWLGAAVAIHATFSLAFGLAYGLVLPLVGPIPGPFAWGGLLMPLLWTGVSYSLMGVVNPLLQERVNWPWFIVSQFVFGVAAAIIVVRTEEIQIPPAGHGPDA